MTRLISPPPIALAAILIAILAAARQARSPASESAPAAAGQAASAGPLWVDVTPDTIGTTAFWTNKVEIADLDGDGRPDLLFANGGDYSTPGTPEPNQVFLQAADGFRFVDRTSDVLGPTPDLARVVKARDFNGDGRIDIVVGTTYQTQSRLYLGEGRGRFQEVTATHLPGGPLSVGDVEPGDVDGDGDLDLVLADWGAGDNMSNDGGRTRLWLNDGAARFTDATGARLPDLRVRFSWDLELADVDNDTDLDLLISCKRCGGSYLFRNDGAGKFEDDPRGLPQYTNNYEFEPMDLDGDGFLDLVTINDGEIAGGNTFSRREHVFRNDGKGRFRDMTDEWWPPASNVGEDDNMAAFLDYDSDGDADFVVGSLSGPDRLLINDGHGRLTVRLDVFGGEDTPGTLGLALADLDRDGRMDVVQGQGEHKTAVGERVFSGRGLAVDTAPPTVTMVTTRAIGGSRRVVHARVHDRKSPSLPFEWRRVAVEWTAAAGKREAAMRWYGEYLWRADWPSDLPASAPYRVCASDAQGNTTCADGTHSPVQPGLAQPLASLVQPPAAPSPVRHVGTMSELMVTVIRPASDALFYIETRPPADGDGWTALEGQALMLAEAANLLMLPGRARDQEQWIADAALMRDAGAAAFKAAKTRKVEEVAAVSDQLYESCTACHQHYRPGYGRRPPPR